MKLLQQGCVLLASCLLATAYASEETSIKIYQTESADRDVHTEETIRTEKRVREFKRNFDFIASLRVGADIADIGKDQHVLLSPLDPKEDNFLVEDEWHLRAMWGAMAGIEMPLEDEYEDYRWQTGLAYYQTQNFDIKGVEETFSQPALANRNFEYSVRNIRVLWENKLLREVDEHIYVYLFLGLGVNINSAFDYKNQQANSPGVLPNPAFDDNTQYSFSYSVGFGAEMDVMEDLRAGVGYQFSDLGRVELGEIDSALASSQTLEHSNTLTNEFIFNLTYLF